MYGHPEGLSERLREVTWPKISQRAIATGQCQLRSSHQMQAVLKSSCCAGSFAALLTWLRPKTP